MVLNKCQKCNLILKVSKDGYCIKCLEKYDFCIQCKNGCINMDSNNVRLRWCKDCEK